MTIEQFVAEAPKLPEQARAELLGQLLRSFADASAMDQEVAEAWAQEMARRDEKMEPDAATGIPAEEVFKELSSIGK